MSMAQRESAARHWIRSRILGSTKTVNGRPEEVVAASWLATESGALLASNIDTTAGVPY
jgi:hypothetical protein